MCAIVGLIHTQKKSTNAISNDAFRILSSLQHRGQDSSGMVSWSMTDQAFACHKKYGLVSDVYNADSINALRGNILVGHNRYATIGSLSDSDLQPLLSGFPLGVSLAHNGNLVNYTKIKNRLMLEYGAQFLTNNDAECFLTLFNYYYSKFKVETITFELLSQIFKKISTDVDGAYSLILSIAKFGLVGFRDPHGIRPLVLGKKITDENSVFCLVSETAGLNAAGFEYVRDVLPGELILIDLDGKITSRQLNNKKPAECMFEWVYFAAAESKINNLSVYQARLNLGKQLSHKLNKMIKLGQISPDIVSPVPDTSRTAAIAISEEINIPYREALIKNRYIQRSFILNSQKEREEAIDNKLIPIESEIYGKKILLIDDSIVRGTTSKKIIKLLKDKGAKEVYLAVTCPPIRYSCFYGIDFPDEKELIAGEDDVSSISKKINADHLIYLDIEGLKNSLLNKSLCTGCLDNKYPTCGIERKDFANLRKSQKSTSIEVCNHETY